MLVQFVLIVVVLSEICFSVLIQLIESFELLCVCSSDLDGSGITATIQIS